MPWGFILRIGAPIAVAVLLFLWGKSVGSAGEVRRQAQEIARATQEAIRIGEKRQSHVNGALDAYRKKTSVPADRNELAGLRDGIARLTASDSYSCRADAERVRVLSELFGEGGQLLQEGKEHVGRLADKSTALQAVIEGLQLGP